LLFWANNKFIIFTLIPLVLSIGIAPVIPFSDATESTQIPDWVKNTMQWYLDGVISEDEFVRALQFLVNEKILVIPAADTNNDPHSTDTLITNQQHVMQNLNSKDLIVSDILQECIRDNGCVINRLTSLSISEPQHLVLSVLNGVVSEWEKEQVTCHEIAHHLGVFLYKYFDGDVSEALSHVDSKCGNSLYHGVIEFSLIDQMNSKNIGRDDVDITSTCKNVGSSTTTNLHIQCVHGLGHAIAKLYENDVFEGIKRCDELEIFEDQDMCYDGLLMENNNEDYFTGGGDYDENDTYYPCSALDEKYKKNCYFYQGYHILRENEESYEPSFEQCINMPDKNYIGKCIGAVSQEMTYHHFYNNLDETVKMCNTVDAKYQIGCILSSLDALTLYIDEDLGYEFCQMVRVDQKDECMNRWESVRTYVKTT